MKISVGLFFGGQSVEHEVSVITGIQAYHAFDTDKYDVTPVYITKKNEFYVGESIGDIAAYKNIPTLLEKSTRVVAVNEGGKVYLTELNKKPFKKSVRIGIDVAFPAVHGTNVEDGTLAGFLRMLCIPYVGCDVTSSALGMDKAAMKAVLIKEGINVLPCITLNIYDHDAKPDEMMDRVEKEIHYPVIVKPVNLGSSVGIKIAHDRKGLEEALNDAFSFAQRVLVEKAITNLKEVNCSVLGDTEHAEASECESPVAKDEILSYKDKYMSGATSSKQGGSKGGNGMASLSRELPANITPENREKIRQMSIDTFKALGCNGVARIDCMIDLDDGQIYVNEINTIPGSLSFYLWEPVGKKYDELLDDCIRLALKRNRELESISFSFDTNLLANANLGGAKK